MPRHPNLDIPFFVYTDASDVGLDSILTQKKWVSHEEVIGFASLTLNEAECNYTVTGKECRAVVWAVGNCPHYLEPKVFTVLTLRLYNGCSIAPKL